MQDHCSPPSSLVHRFITPPHISTAVDQGRVSTRLAASPLRHHCVVLLPISTTAGLGPRRDWGRRRLRSDQANGENAERSARAPLKNGAALHGERVQNSY